MSYLLERVIRTELETRAKNNHDITDANVQLLWTKMNENKNSCRNFFEYK